MAIRRKRRMLSGNENGSSFVLSTSIESVCVLSLCGRIFVFSHEKTGSLIIILFL